MNARDAIQKKLRAKRDQALATRSPSQQLEVLKIVEQSGIGKDDPFWDVLVALGVIESVVVSAPDRIQEAVDSAVANAGRLPATEVNRDSQPQSDRQQKRQMATQIENLMDIADVAIEAAAKKAFAEQFQRFGVRAAGVLGVGVAIGAILALWFGHPEARRIYEWNQSELRECAKVQRKTCNLHIVPPEQR